MKKFFFVAAAALTLGFASCSETPKADEGTVFVEQLKAQLEAGNIAEMETTMDAAMQKAAELAAENPEAGQAIVTKIQEFIKENKEQLIAIGTPEENLITIVETPADVGLSSVLR